MSSQSFDRVSLGEYLAQAGLITARQLRDALDLQEREGGTLGTNLLAIRAVEESTLLRALGTYHSSPTVSAGELDGIPWSVLRSVSLELVRRYSIVPFRIQGNTICVASRRPGSIAIENEIVLATSRLTRTYLSLDLRLQEALQSYYGIRADPRAIAVASRLAETPTPATEVTSSEPFPLSGYSSAGGGSSAVSRWLGSSPSATGTAEAGAGSSIEDRQHPTALADTAGTRVAWERFEKPRRQRVGDVLASQPHGANSSVVEDVLWSEVHPATEPAPEIEAAGAPVPADAIDRVRDRDRIADQLLSASASFRRRLLLAHRSRRVLGWKGDGAGIVPRLLGQVTFPVEESPPFFAVYSGSDFWLGPLLPSPGTDQLLKVLGGRKPTSCIVLPVRAGDKIAAFLYVDNGDSGVLGAPLAEILELARTAGQSFERLIQKVRPAESEDA